VNISVSNSVEHGWSGIVAGQSAQGVQLSTGLRILFVTRIQLCMQGINTQLKFSERFLKILVGRLSAQELLSQGNCPSV
jgi:hypothetical protein